MCYLDRPIQLKIESSAALRNRFLVLRKKVKKSKSRPKTFKAIFHLNVFPGEYEETQEPAVFDEPHNSNPLIRDLQTTVTTLQRSLQETRQELSDQGETVVELNGQVKDLTETNTFLSGHVAALEQETEEQHRKIQNHNNNNPSTSAAAKTSVKKVLGTTKFNELGRDAKNKTRAAYKEKAQELNEFGANRGLTVNKIILRDENGKKVPINVEKPHTYSELTPEEKSEVVTASAWKDLNRLSDRVYSTLTKVGSIPPASHVKSYEKEINSLLGPILPVFRINRKSWKYH